MKYLLLTVAILMSISSAFAQKSPYYPIGKKDYVQVVEAATTLEDLRDANKTVIVQFSAEWCGPCIQFWPFMYTLDQLKPDAYIIKVVDGTAGWDDITQIADSGNVSVPGIPFMVVLAPGETGVKYQGNSFSAMDNLLNDQGIQKSDFNEAVIKNIEAYNNSL